MNKLSSNGIVFHLQDCNGNFILRGGGWDHPMWTGAIDVATQSNIINQEMTLNKTNSEVTTVLFLTRNDTKSTRYKCRDTILK